MSENRKGNKFLSVIFPVKDERNIGYFILRLFVGAMFIVHGYPKIIGGPEEWVKFGSVMGKIGITFGHTFWGFMAAVAEFCGGILLILGLLTPIASFLIFFTMLVAAFVYSSDAPLLQRELPLIYFVIMLMFLAKGAGKYSLDYAIFRKLRT